MPNRYPAALLSLPITLGWLLVSVSSVAEVPEVRGTQPVGLQRGEKTTLRITGERLADAQQVHLTDSTGIVFGKVNTDPKGKHLEVPVEVAPDAPIGERQFRVRSTNGWSYVKTLQIGEGERIGEEEPNNSADKAQPVTLPITVEGEIPPEDRDEFLVVLRQGERLTAEVEAMRLGRKLLDLELLLLDPSGDRITEVDDTLLLNNDPFFSVTAPKDGRYRVVVREASGLGQRDAPYRLHLGNWKRPVAVEPLGGTSGEQVEATFHFADGTRERRQVTWPSDEGTAILHYRDPENPTGLSPLSVRVNSMRTQPEVPGNERRDAVDERPFEIPVACEGVLKKPGDQDWFAVRAPANRRISVRGFARALGSPADLLIQVYGPDGKRLESNDDRGHLDSSLTFKTGAAGLYFVMVRDFLEAGSEDHRYRIEVEEEPQSLRLSLRSRRNNDSQNGQTMLVPKGGRLAKVFNVKRNRVGGELELDWKGAPPGVRLGSEPVPSGSNKALVLLEANGDAPLGGEFVEFEIREKDGEAKGGYGLQADLVRQGNQGVYYITHVDRVAVAVGERAPFRLIVKERPNLVQGGRTEWTVLVERDNGFDDRVVVDDAWTPNGVSVAEVSVSGKEQEAKLRFEAKDDAPVGRHQVLLAARWGRERQLSTDLIPLHVIEAFLEGRIARASVEAGSSATVEVELESLRPLDGEATLELVGLPTGVSSKPIRVKEGQKSGKFHIVAAADARPTRTTRLACRLLLKKGDRELSQRLAEGGQLRVDPAPTAGDQQTEISDGANAYAAAASRKEGEGR